MIAKPVPVLEEIQKAVQVIVGRGRGRIVEVRAPNTPNGTWSGYYNNESLVRHVFDLSSKETTPAVFWTIQELKTDLLNSGNENKLRPGASKTTPDTEVTRYIWLPIDCDPKRPAGTSSTDLQKEAALEVACDIQEYLQGRGIHSVLADSGNGYHVLVPIDILNQNGTNRLIGKVLKALNIKFSTSIVGVDTSVCNPSRILKIYGTVTRKGEHTDERPWRLSRLIEVPENLVTLQEEQVKELLAELTKDLSEEKVAEIHESKKYVAPIPGTKIAEHRNDAVRDYAWHVWNSQTSDTPDVEDLKAKVRNFNQQFCAPPLDELELDRTMLSSTVKKHRKIDEVPIVGGARAGTNSVSSIQGAVISRNPFEDMTDDTLRSRTKNILAQTIQEIDKAADPRIVVLNTIANLRQLDYLMPGFPKPLTEKSLWGLMGDFVDIAYPTTVASKEMILFQAMPVLGVVLGKKFYVPFGADKHYGTVWTLNIARTADGKGSVKNIVLSALKEVDDYVSCYGVKTNISSGEGLARVACGSGMANTLTKLVWVMPEMTMLFNSMHRDGSILSHMLREAYDSNLLENQKSDAKKSYTATNYLLAMMGTTSPAELRQAMPAIDWHNGIANRFLWNVGARTKKLNTSRTIPNFSKWAERFKKIMELSIKYPGNENIVDYSVDGLDCWNAWVDGLPEEDEDTIYGLSQGRIKPNCLRVAMFYAQIDEGRLDGGPLLIEPKHIEAGIEIVTRSADSTSYYLNGGSGKTTAASDSDIKRIYDAIVTKARETGKPELTRNEITRMFRRLTDEQKDRVCLAANLHLEQRPNPAGRGVPVDVWCVSRG